MDDVVACVAVIGPDDNPLLFRKYCDENHEFEIDSLIFCALDHFDGPAGGGQRAATTRGAVGSFIGNISMSDRFQIWGYRAALKYKIIVLTFHLMSIEESSIRAMCENVRDIMFDAITDPFYIPFSMMEQPHIRQKIDNAAEAIRLAAAK